MGVFMKKLYSVKDALKRFLNVTEITIRRRVIGELMSECNKNGVSIGLNDKDIVAYIYYGKPWSYLTTSDKEYVVIKEGLQR